MYLSQLTKSGKSIFSLEDLGKIWKITDKDYLKVVASRLFQRGALIRVRQGLYVLRTAYDRMELANKLKTPSYVSLETVLQKETVVFQEYGSTIFSVSDNTLSKEVDGQVFQYSKIKDAVLFNPLGIARVGGTIVATAERAVCDRVYLSPGYYFDNLRGLNREKLRKISRIYENERVREEIEKLVGLIKD